jgi:hypothetical protein
MYLVEVYVVCSNMYVGTYMVWYFVLDEQSAYIGVVWL